ncbi:MAG TPA: hypothetical protein VF751_01715 [Chthoniobacterales bacterium]
MQLQPQRVAQQTVEQWIRRRGKIFLQTLGLQTQTCQGRLGIVRECSEEFLDLRVPFLFALREIKQRQTATNQRRDQDAAFPQKHLVMPMKLDGAFEVRLID